MNLNAYDLTQDTTNVDGYISKKYQKLYINNIGYYPFCTFMTRYDKETNNNNLYIALLANRHPTAKCYANNGTAKKLSISLNNVWTEYGFNSVIKKEITNIKVNIVDKQEDGIVITISEL